MNPVAEKARAARTLLRRQVRSVAVQVRSRVRGVLDAGAFDDLTGFAMFVGYPRSGHTLLAATLDAHPQIAIGHEQSVFKMALAGHPRNAIFAELVRSSRVFLERGAGSDAGHVYQIDGQWQGRHRDLRVVGIQRGGRASRLILKHPAVIDAVRRTTALPLRVIHALRNPFDNIASIHSFNGGKLSDAARLYFEGCDGLVATQKLLAPGEIMSLRHEDFVAHPRAGLTALCQYLGVQPGAEYIDACAALVRPRPNLTRKKAPWTPQLLDEVKRRVARYPFLEGYAFD